MVRNLTAMNRLNQIRASNPLLNFRKAHSKQDNIWDKQYAENRRNELKELLPDLLKRYPSKEEVVEAWKSGIELAKDMARRAGMGPDDIGELDGGVGGGGGDDDDPDDWFSKPFKFMKFESMFNDMLSEEDVRSSPSDTEIENEDGCISFEECVQQSVIDDSIDQMLINECQQALVQESENCIAEENGNEDTTQKFSLKIFVPHWMHINTSHKLFLSWHQEVTSLLIG